MAQEVPPSLFISDSSTLGVKINGETDEFSKLQIQSSLIDDEQQTSREDLQLNELREARIRAAQMEKTMRWWSDCTANWRDKWGKVKTERNKARDEVKILKQRLDSANQEIYKLKRERNEFREGNTKLREDVEKMEAELRRDRRAFVPPLRVVQDSGTTAAKAVSELSKPGESNRKGQINTVETPEATRKLMETVIEGHKIKSDKKEELLQAMSFTSGNVILNYVQEDSKENSQLVDDLRQELRVLKEKLDDTENQVLEEKRSKETLSEAIDELKAEIDHLKGTIQEETIAKGQAVNELTRLKEEKERKISTISDVRDSYSKENVDRKLKELRGEIEKLQKEGASEWNKREKLESEKLGAQRENKKLKHQITDLENELKTIVNERSQAVSFGMKQIQTELEDKKKELADLKAAHAKLKRNYQDKKEDAMHTKTRVDHHEDEIKKLRTRIDELKQKLISTEDEVDEKENLVRKLQRSLDEQTQQCHVLRVQMEHLQSRWKQMTLMARGARRGEKNSTSEEDNLLDFDDL